MMRGGEPLAAHPLVLNAPYRSHPVVMRGGVDFSCPVLLVLNVPLALHSFCETSPSTQYSLPCFSKKEFIET